MNESEIIFQFAEHGSDNWQDNPQTDYLNTTYLRDLPLGKVMTLFQSDVRRVPKDPLLRAIVIATTDSKRNPRRLRTPAAADPERRNKI